MAVGTAQGGAMAEAATAGAVTAEEMAVVTAAETGEGTAAGVKAEASMAEAAMAVVERGSFVT